MPSSLSGRTLRGAIGWGTQAQGGRARSAQGGCWGAQSVREIGRCAAWAAAGGGRARRPALTPVDWPSSGGASLRRSGSCGRCHPFGSVERERSFELPPPVRRALAALPAVRLGRLQALPGSQATVCARHPAAARPACAPHRSARSARCPISVASPATASAGWRYWRRRGLTARQPSPGQRQRHHEAGPGPDAGAR